MKNMLTPKNFECWPSTSLLRQQWTSTDPLCMHCTGYFLYTAQVYLFESHEPLCRSRLKRCIKLDLTIAYFIQGSLLLRLQNARIRSEICMQVNESDSICCQFSSVDQVTHKGISNFLDEVVQKIGKYIPMLRIMARDSPSKETKMHKGNIVIFLYRPYNTACCQCISKHIFKLKINFILR